MKLIAGHVVYMVQSLLILLLEKDCAQNYQSKEYPLKRMQHAALDVMMGIMPLFYIDARGTESSEAKLFHAAKTLGISETVFKNKLHILAAKYGEI